MSHRNQRKCKRGVGERVAHNNDEVLLLLRCALGMAAPSDLEDPPVVDFPELPAEIWALIWPLVAAQSGFVGAWQLIGGCVCKAATEGWGACRGSQLSCFCFPR